MTETTKSSKWTVTPKGGTLATVLATVGSAFVVGAIDQRAESAGDYYGTAETLSEKIRVLLNYGPTLAQGTAGAIIGSNLQYQKTAGTEELTGLSKLEAYGWGAGKGTIAGLAGGAAQALLGYGLGRMTTLLLE